MQGFISETHAYGRTPHNSHALFGSVQLGLIICYKILTVVKFIVMYIRHHVRETLFSIVYYTGIQIIDYSEKLNYELCWQIVILASTGHMSVQNALVFNQ